MHFKDHFSQVAALYCAFRPHYPADLFDYLAGLCAERRVAWDCACGNGQASIPLAARFDVVIATDASGEQIAAAPAHPGVTYRVAAAEQSGLEAKSVDLVTVAQALHWLDCDAFYREVKRVLRESGALAVWAYGNPSVEDAKVNAVIESFYTHKLGPYWPPERKFVETGYRTLPFPFDEIAPPSFEMSEQWTLPQLLGYLRSWSATTRYLKQHAEDPVQSLAEELLVVWGKAGEARRVTWPCFVRVGRLLG